MYLTAARNVFASNNTSYYYVAYIIIVYGLC